VVKPSTRSAITIPVKGHLQFARESVNENMKKQISTAGAAQSGDLGLISSETTLQEVIPDL